MNLYKSFGVIVALLWTPCVFAQLTMIQDKEGHSKIALKLPDPLVVPASSLVKPVTLGNSFRKPEPVRLNLEGQFEELKTRCPIIQAEKATLHLTGERHNTERVGLEWKTVNDLNSYQFIVE